eukprot:COSAG02_NODE_4615_length_5161_cov_10.381865_6_plen_197_part_00
MDPEIRDIFQATCGPKVYESQMSCSETIPPEFFSVFQRFREWRNKLLAEECDPLPSANPWAPSTSESDSEDLFPNENGVGVGVGAPNENGVGVGVSPSLSPFNNRLGQHLGNTPPAPPSGPLIEDSPELSWQLNLPVDSIEESSQETASQDLEAKNELANAQARIAKQNKRPSQMRTSRETMLKRRTLTQQGVVTK